MEKVLSRVKAIIRNLRAFKYGGRNRIASAAHSVASTEVLDDAIASFAPSKTRACIGSIVFW